MSKVKQSYERPLIQPIELDLRKGIESSGAWKTEIYVRSLAKFEEGKKYNPRQPQVPIQRKEVKRKFSQIKLASSSKFKYQFASENKELNITLVRLQTLLEEEDEDDYGVAKPSAYAYGTALALVAEAARLIGDRFTRASASIDDRGGIRLTWTRPQAEVRLVCTHQSDKPTYLYHEAGDEYGVEYDVSASALAHWLDWLNHV
jgi:hypothetical protein